MTSFPITVHFHFLGEYLKVKIHRLKTTGTCGKINTSYRLFAIIGHYDTQQRKIRSFPNSWYTAFSFLAEYSKLDRVKTMGTRGKINAV